MTSDAAYLRELAGRFSSVPTMYGVNTTDAQRLREIATKLERGADWPEDDRPPGRPDLSSCVHRPMCSGYAEHQRVSDAFYAQNKPEDSPACPQCGGPSVGGVRRHFSYCLLRKRNS